MWMAMLGKEQNKNVTKFPGHPQPRGERVQRELNVKQNVFCRVACGQVAQIAGPSALEVRILDRVAVFGVLQRGPQFRR